MKNFVDTWEESNKVNIEGLPYIDDNRRKLFYRLTEAKINPIGAPLLVILHGHGTKSATKFQHKHWNVLTPIDHFGYEKNGAWWLGEHGDFFIKELLQKLIKEISIKYECQNNIYFYGSSMGAYGAIYHGILSHARAVYANVPQIQFFPSTYFKSFQKNAEYIFNMDKALPIENDLLNFLNQENKFPIFFLCENILEEKHHLNHYLKEHTLAFLEKCYQYQIKAHIEILPQEGHTKNYGINEVLEKFEKFAKPLKETKCREIIQVLSENSTWFLNTGRTYKTHNKILFIDKLSLEKPSYLIYGNKKVKQEVPSKNLIDITGISKLYLKIYIDFPALEVEFSILVQLYNKSNLVTSTKYILSSGSNNIDIPKLHLSISRLKLMFRIATKSTKEFSASISNVELCIEEYQPIQKEIANIKPKNNLLPNIKHLTLTDNYEFNEGNLTYSIDYNDTIFNFYLNYHPGRKMVIALPGATNRQKPFYNFQRYSWSENMNYSFMSFLDPTIQENNELSIGWFQGKFNDYALPKLISLLKNLFSQNNIREEDIIFFGSSAGGFSSLSVANYFPNSIIIVINPQIYVYHYVKSAYEALIAYSYPNKSKKEVYDTYKDRLSVYIDLKTRIAPIFYFQNISDVHHMEKHLKPFIEHLDSNSYQIVKDGDMINSDTKLYVALYDDPESGHSPPNKEKTLKIIEDVIESKIKKGFKWEF